MKTNKYDTLDREMLGRKAITVRNDMERQWKVSMFNRAGRAHMWKDSPVRFYARSACGLDERKENLQDMSEATGRCRVCEKASLRPNAALSGPHEKD